MLTDFLLLLFARLQMLREAEQFGGGDQDCKSFIESASVVLKTQVHVISSFLIRRMLFPK